MKKTTLLAAALIVIVLVGLSVWQWQTWQPAPAEISNTNATPAATLPTTSPNSWAIQNTAKVYVVALEDNGVNGKAIGCGDSLVMVERSITPTRLPVTAALEALLAEPQANEETGYYNAWAAASGVSVDYVNIQDSKVTVELKGTLSVGGACDVPRLVEQMQATARQLDGITDVTILLNQQKLEDYLSTK